MEVIERISLREVREARPKTIYYGANTVWWSHDPSHLSLTPEPSEELVARMADNFRRAAGKPDADLAPYIERARRAASHRMPCDPRGGMLFETDNVEGFLTAAENSREHYGRHGLRAFMAGHHLNSFKSFEARVPWCESSWDAYNDALDRFDARRARGSFNPKVYYDQARTLLWGRDLDPRTVAALDSGEVFTLLDKSGNPFRRILKDSYGETRESEIRNVNDLTDALGIPPSPFAEGKL